MSDLEPLNENDSVVLTPQQQHRRRMRNIAIAVVLVGLVIMFYAMTIIKMGGNVANRPL
jgi:hypothetical protein